MKNILLIILEHFQPILLGLFAVFCCLVTGQFGWALISGIVTIVVLVILLILYRDEYELHKKHNNNFRKWTKGK